MSLITLDDYCLVNIFKYITLDELLFIHGKIHPRIDNAIEWQLNRYRSIDFNMRFPPQYDAYQLRILGQHIEIININVGYSIRTSDVLSILQPLFTGAKEGGRLKAFKIQHAKITSEYLNIVRLIAPLLYELDLSRCEMEDLSQFQVLLQSATNLKTLALSNNDMSCVELSVLSRIKVLKINWLVGTELFDVSAIIQQFPFLTVLVCQSDKVDVYGPPLLKKSLYFY